ncbi:MAG: hypothetical protein QF805_28370, partial [Pirellulaceae bacterium]|nr:hypothetical protein [Pirellulaceae bacterium]
FFFELLYIEPVGSSIRLPIDVADRVTRQIWSMLGKFNGEAVVRTAVQTADVPFNDVLRAELEALNLSQRPRI